MNWEQLKKEVNFRADRSSGSGGQHVNKVATKVTLAFYPAESYALSETEKQLILSRLNNKLTKDGALIVSEQSHRSQLRNRKFAFQKLEALITKALLPAPPKRKKIRRKVNKKVKRKANDRLSEKKANRKKIQIYKA